MRFFLVVLLFACVDAGRKGPRGRRGGTIRLVPHLVEEDRAAARKKPAPLAKWLDSLDGKMDGVLAETNRGAGVTVYVVDSGCAGNVALSFVQGDLTPRWDGANHGSRVASIVERLVPDVRLVCLKVFGANGKGSVARVNAAFDYVTANCEDPTKCVVNFSGQAAGSRTMTAAVRRMLARGIVLVTASGNAPTSNAAPVPSSESTMDSCAWSPSGIPGVVSVGSVNSLGGVSTWSKIGSCVHVFAPGDGISLGNGAYMYGTSFSCAVETARRAQCASVGNVRCDGPYANVTGFPPAVVRAFPALVRRTTSRSVLLT